MQENNSFTTNQNIQFSSMMINQLLEDNIEIIIVCDSIRKLKVSIIALKWLGKYKKTIIGFNFQRNLKEIFKQIPGTIKDILAAFFPYLDLYYVKLRKKKWGTRI